MTAPLVPPDVDLRDFTYIPIYRHRLLMSRFNHLASDAEWRAGFTLWLASWDQQPAGSLPDDERELCQLAGLGRDIRQWRKVKKWALHNWQLCDDGRLYHPVVAEIVQDAWNKKHANRHRTSAATQARVRRRSGPRNDQRNVQRDVQRDDDVTTNVTLGNRMESNILSPLERKESQYPARVGASANGAGNGAEKPGKASENISPDPLGSLRSPARSRSPSNGQTLKQNRKEQLRQKLFRFVNSTQSGADRSTAIAGLMGEDPGNSAQWWFDTLDQLMRAKRWDDTTEHRDDTE
jgi:hypothetical protein